MASFNILRVQFVNDKYVPRYCRACACEIKKSPCDIENNSEKPELPILLKRYVPEFNIKVANAYLCTDCVSILYMFHSFKRKCLRTEQDLRLHIRNHPEAKTIYLNEVFAPEEPRTTKAPKAPKVEKKFVCKICNRVFVARASLNSHTRNYHGRERFQCDQCSRQFISKSLCDTHAEYHKRPDSGRFVCKICNFVYHAACSLNKHNMYKHMSDVHRPFKCKVCGRRFVEKAVLDVHMQIHEKEQFKCKCTYCNRQYYSKSSLCRHVRLQHTAHKQDPFKCTECSRVFLVKSVYDRHLAYHQKPDADRYVCEICNFVFQTGKSARKHRKMKHSNTYEHPKRTTTVVQPV